MAAYAAAATLIGAAWSGGAFYDYRFHYCYAEKLDAAACGINAYYAPGVHLLARGFHVFFNNWPLSFAAVAFLLALALGAILLLYSTASLAVFFAWFLLFLTPSFGYSWVDHFAVGVLSSYAVFVLLALLLAFPQRVSRLQRIGLILLGVFFHHYAWLILLATALLLEVEERVWRTTWRTPFVLLGLLVGLPLGAQLFSFSSTGSPLPYIIFNSRLLDAAGVVLAVAVGTAFNLQKKGSSVFERGLHALRSGSWKRMSSHG